MTYFVMCNISVMRALWPFQTLVEGIFQGFIRMVEEGEGLYCEWPGYIQESVPVY